MAAAGFPTGRVTNPTMLAPYVGAELPIAELESRLDAVRQRLEQLGQSALLVANPENVYYLTGLNHQGYFSFTLLVVPIRGRPLLVAREMERPTLTAQVPGCELLLYGDGDGDGSGPADATVRAIRQASASGDTIGVGRGAMFFPVRIWEYVQQRLPDRDWADDAGIVETARAVKSPAEVALVRRAAMISDRAVQAGIAAAHAGTTERAVAAAVYHEMILAGSEHPGFAPFVRSSDILQQEHVTWRDRELLPGTGLLMELSGCVYRYHAPLTRMAFVGEPPPEAERAAETGLDGLEAVRRTLRPGVTAATVYAAWQRAVDARLGHDRYRRHHCGYSVGIGFPPSWVGGGTVIGLRADSRLELASGMVFHVLSWILGQYAVDFCVSDTFLVTDDGCELLTETPRWPIVLR